MTKRAQLENLMDSLGRAYMPWLDDMVQAESLIFGASGNRRLNILQGSPRLPSPQLPHIQANALYTLAVVRGRGQGPCGTI